jgi:hypothetical protein
LTKRPPRANEPPIRLNISLATTGTKPGIVGPKGGPVFRRPFNGGGFSRDDSYWDVDTAGCWQLHGDEYKWGSFDLRVEKKLSRRSHQPEKIGALRLEGAGGFDLAAFRLLQEDYFVVC